MAKAEKVAQAAEAVAATPAPQPEKAATNKVGAAVMLPNGQRRIDYIRTQFAAGKKRGEIAKELGVPYQIVFAATKTKKEAAPAGDAPAAPAAQ